MKRFVQQMSPEDRKTWRKWKAWWAGFYAVVVLGLIVTGFFVPKTGETELAQSGDVAPQTFQQAE